MRTTDQAQATRILTVRTRQAASTTFVTFRGEDGWRWSYGPAALTVERRDASGRLIEQRRYCDYIEHHDREDKFDKE